MLALKSVPHRIGEEFFREIVHSFRRCSRDPDRFKKKDRVGRDGSGSGKPGAALCLELRVG
jgi:hypothetical protein